jgi:hypothetical protein
VSQSIPDRTTGDPADWPAWTDNWHWTPTDPDGFDAAMEAVDVTMPLPDCPDLRDPSDWPAEPGPLEYPSEDDERSYREMFWGYE